MQLHLIRHTTPAVQPGICYGQSDVDVTATFPEEAQAVRNKLSAIAPVAIYSSPLTRATKLAATLRLGVTCHDTRLMEMDFGAWEMLAWESIPREQLDHWGQAYTRVAPPKGETFTALHARATEFLQELKTRHHGQDVIVVTHAGVIRALLAEVLNLPLTEVFRFHLDFGGVTQLRFGDNLPAVGYVNR